ncbi:hypothetical protein BLNAU_5826 [Blattamonas nauphoetae]|uniref:Membrane transport protein MMPL domain-containing protein n=1 Tax=Blattamonas nauphoetae TaxID=2049346 RepID=A0ABQ9Y6B8_9EUKA|nr:hypothetical protein BLNAU_5826 [Blattamonas nauphoetae]
MRLMHREEHKDWKQGLAYAFFHARDNSSILDVHCLEAFSVQFETRIEHSEADDKAQLLHTPLMRSCLSDNMVMQASTISLNGHSPIIVIEFEHVGKKLAQDFEVLHKMFDSEYKSACSPAERAQLSAGLLGMSEFFRDAKNSIFEDVLKMCIIVIPFALVILLWPFRSIRLFLLAIFNSFTVAAVSLFITYFFAAYVLKVVTFAPAVLLAAAVAISADYSLFILRRFRDGERIPLHSCVLAKPIQNGMKESQQSAPIEVSLSCPLSKAHISNSFHTTMNTVGRIVAVSGLVLVCCFTSLFVLRNEMLASLVICATVTTIINILTALSLIRLPLSLPVLLRQFHQFWVWSMLLHQPKEKDALLA